MIERKDARTVLVINPNTNTATTKMMCTVAQCELAEFSVMGATAARGPKMITDDEELKNSRRYATAAGLSEFMEHPEIVGVIVAAYGDPGREVLADLLPVPVVGLAESSILSAAEAAEPFGIATSTPGLVNSIIALVDDYRGDVEFTGVELTSSSPTILAANPDRQFEELRAAVIACVDKGARAVIIGGGPLSETARRLAALDVSRVIEPVPAACVRLRGLLAREGRDST